MRGRVCDRVKQEGEGVVREYEEGEEGILVCDVVKKGREGALK